MTVAPPPVAEQSPEPAVASAPRANTFGLVAIILAGVGTLLAVIPPTSGFAWLILVPAIVFAIIGLTRKGAKKGLSLAAIIIAPIAWILSIVIFFVSALLLFGGAIDAADEAPEASSPDSSEVTEGAPEAVAGIGDTVTNSDGVAFTVNSVTCGLPTAGEDFLLETAKGQFCQVAFTLLNGSTEALNPSGYDFKAYIGEAEYESNSSANTFDGEYFITDLNPGLSTEGVIFFDIAVGGALETVAYEALLSFVEPVVVTVS